MKPVRALCILIGAFLVLCLCSNGAMARARSRNNRNNNDRGFTGRIIDRDDGRDRRTRESERKKKVEEERKRKLEEKRKKAEEKKKAKEEKKKAAEAKRQEQIEKTKELARERAEARKGKAKGGPEKKGGGEKDAEGQEEEAAKLVEEAEGQFTEGELLPGVALLRQALDEYEDTAAAAKAQKRLDQLLQTEPFGAMIYHGEAEELFAAQRYRHALNKYSELLEAFPESEQAAQAKKRLAEIREGDLLSKTAYTDEELEDARLWFLAGNIHFENGRRSRALTSYRRAIEEYPGSAYAQKAEERLTALR